MIILHKIEISHRYNCWTMYILSSLFVQFDTLRIIIPLIYNIWLPTVNIKFACQHSVMAMKSLEQHRYILQIVTVIPIK